MATLPAVTSRPDRRGQPLHDLLEADRAHVGPRGLFAISSSCGLNDCIACCTRPGREGRVTVTGSAGQPQNQAAAADRRRDPQHDRRWRSSLAARYFVRGLTAGSSIGRLSRVGVTASGVGADLRLPGTDLGVWFPRWTRGRARLFLHAPRTWAYDLLHRHARRPRCVPGPPELGFRATGQPSAGRLRDRPPGPGASCGRWALGLFSRAFDPEDGRVQRVGLSTSPDLLTWERQPWS